MQEDMVEILQSKLRIDLWKKEYPSLIGMYSGMPYSERNSHNSIKSVVLGENCLPSIFFFDLNYLVLIIRSLPEKNGRLEKKDNKLVHPWDLVYISLCHSL